jgi:hypothetical protein
MADNMGHGLLSTGKKEAQPTEEKMPQLWRRLYGKILG